jgi:hypothetical protein
MRFTHTLSVESQLLLCVCVCLNNCIRSNVRKNCVSLQRHPLYTVVADSITEFQLDHDQYDETIATVLAMYPTQSPSIVRTLVCMFKGGMGSVEISSTGVGFRL